MLREGNKKVFILFKKMIFYLMILANLNFINIQCEVKGNSVNNALIMIEKVNNFNPTIYNNNCFGSLIIGGGPAGLTAATYCARFGIPTGIIMGQEPGGALMKTGVVENWPGIIGLEGKYIIDSAIKQTEKAGAIVLYEYVADIIVNTYPYKVVTNKNTYYAFSIMIATGSTIKKLGCMGENEYWGKGVSSCAICDGVLHKGKSVLVVGGGDSACEEVLQLVPHADDIYVLVRGNAMRASHALQEKIKKYSQVHILYETELKEIIGNKEYVTNARLSYKGKEYIFSEKFLGKKLSGVFIAIGQIPNTNLVKDILNVNSNGLIECEGRTQKTSFPGFFCGGDVSNFYKQASVAAGEGAIAAINMFEFLQKYQIDLNFYQINKKIWVLSKSNNNCVDGVCSISEKSNDASNMQNTKYMNIINTEKEYRKLIDENKDFYIINIFGSNCPACTVMKNTIDQYVKKSPKLAIYSINHEKIPAVAKIYSVRSIPVTILIKNGKVVSKRIGSMSLKEFEYWIEKNIN